MIRLHLRCHSTIPLSNVFFLNTQIKTDVPKFPSHISFSINYWRSGLFVPFFHLCWMLLDGVVSKAWIDKHCLLLPWFCWTWLKFNTIRILWSIYKWWCVRRQARPGEWLHLFFEDLVHIWELEDVLLDLIVIHIKRPQWWIARLLLVYLRHGYVLLRWNIWK